VGTVVGTRRPLLCYAPAKQALLWLTCACTARQLLCDRLAGWLAGWLRLRAHPPFRGAKVLLPAVQAWQVVAVVGTRLPVVVS